MNAKLSRKEVRRIRALYQTGSYKQEYLAAIYQVSRAHISRIVNLKRRKDR
jgi:hypothetical protein